MSGIVYLNGKYVEACDAKISVFDRGFLFGDAVYEVIPVYNDRPFFVDRHLGRLKTSLSHSRIVAPQLDWKEIFHNLIKKNGGGNLQIYLQITRGNQGVRKHDIPSGIEPTIVAFTLHTPYASLETKRKGLNANLVEDIRWSRCDIKTTSLLANILLNDDAVSKGANTAILSREGLLTEGSASNVFLVDNGVVYTPPLNNLCLPGITRQIAIELIQSLSWTFREENIPAKALYKAEEVWITSTTKEIYPVTRIDDSPVGDGTAGRYWEQINAKYQQLIVNNYD
ncbi:D-amino acid aminotransferase [Legionella hackeliae]|uniref:Aminodeoxychorismate lyase n=1 Tax=Legionella hackeliae TaxID=449 RepID=A0A0A8UT64_LEGHA|nr:D-amino acid aminotransferase [Legionella hackeliae]KTD11486.1 D-alanine-aminotransferase [Legionella hackeliae]CEK10681.1 putative D-Ala-amino transferase [Legionella hackeliae]STX47428.1 D-alanine transaminase [Legionella hackeliae]